MTTGHARCPAFRRAAARWRAAARRWARSRSPSPCSAASCPARPSWLMRSAARSCSEAPCSRSATGGSTPKSPRAVFLIRTAIKESIPSSINGWFGSMARVVRVAHDRRDAPAQPRGDEPLASPRIEFAKRFGTRPVAALAAPPTPRPALRSSRVRRSRGTRPPRDRDAAARHPPG